MSNTRSLADCIMLLRQSSGNALHERQLMFDINNRLYEITDPVLKKLLTKYTNSHEDINLSKLRIIDYWDKYHRLKSFAMLNITADTRLLFQLREFLTENGANELLSEANINQLRMMVSKYTDKASDDTVNPNDLLNDLKTVSSIIGGPGPTFTRSTSLIASTLSIDLTAPGHHQLQTRKNTIRNLKKRSLHVETRKIQDLFIKDKEPKAIPISELDWRLTSLNNKPSLYTTDTLPKLLKVAKPMPFGETTDKVIRFLVTKEGELIFGLEGKPQEQVPAHFQMADLDIEKAVCITAGNVYFNDDDELTKIDHKSGDFRPPFDSLQHALALLVKARVKFATEVHIDKLNDRGGTEKRFAVKGEEITAHYSAGLMHEKISSVENIHVTMLSRQ